jgi:3-dehydroquinate synthetase
LVAAANLAAELGRCDTALAGRITRLIERLGLPVRAPGYDVDAVLEAMGHDKKRAGKRLRFVIPQALGDVVVIDDPGEELVRRAIQSIVL